MPVSRYRNVSEMPPPPRPSPEDLLRAIAAAWEQAHIRLRPEFPRGLFRYPSVEAAQRDRDAREIEQIQRLRASARRAP